MISENYQAIWQKAASFAARRHAGQLRKDGRTPYFAHPVRVSLIVSHVFGIQEPAVLAIALLHDLIEDTTTDYDELSEEFGQHVANGVAALTKDSRLPEEQREREYDRQVGSASWEARLVKLADAYDNFCDSETDAQRREAAEKAKRAIDCAGDDPRLEQPVKILQRLVVDFAFHDV